MSSVTNHPFYVKTVSSLEKTTVRDKLMRLVQYFSRFLGYYLYRKGYPHALLAQVISLQKALGLTRKALRIGKPLGNLRAVVAELANKTADPVLHFTNLGKNLGTAVFLSLDTLQWLNNVGAKKFANIDAIGRVANRAWLISILSALVQALYIFYRADAKSKALAQESEKDASALKKATQEKDAAKVLILWQGLDALIPATNLGLLNLDDGFIGLAGTITSYLGLKAAW